MLGQKSITMIDYYYYEGNLRSMPMLAMTVFLHHGITIKINKFLGLHPILGLGQMQMLCGIPLLQMQT